MTERELIEQRMVESERNMIELELAKQIKEFLDKGIPKADIAKAAEFSLEYIDSLLEKFYPQTAGTEQTSDIESQLNFLKKQVQILQNKLDNQEFENVQLKQQLNTIQAKGANMAEKIEITQGIQQWEYLDPPSTINAQELNKLGEQGWEAVAVGTNGGTIKTMLKRPKQKKSSPDYGYSR